MRLNKRARHDLMLELEYFMNMLVKHFEYSIKDIKSYEELTDAENEVAKLKLNILKDIIETKMKEKNEKESEKKRLSERNKLLEILAKKEEASLENLSIEELKKKIAELE